MALCIQILYIKCIIRNCKFLVLTSYVHTCTSTIEQLHVVKANWLIVAMLKLHGSYVVIICCFLLQFSNIAQKCYFFSLTSYFGILIVVCLTIIVCFECYSSHILYNCWKWGSESCYMQYNMYTTFFREPFWMFLIVTFMFVAIHRPCPALGQILAAVEGYAALLVSLIFLLHVVSVVMDCVCRCQTISSRIR